MDLRGSGDHSDEDETTTSAGQEIEASEDTPLLPQHYRQGSDDQTPGSNPPDSAAESLLRSFQTSKLRHPTRWPSIVALATLCILVILILCFGFLFTSTVEHYANSAVTFDPTSLSIETFTMRGVRARIRGDINIDASKVTSKTVSRFGRLATWIAKEVESGPTTVEVSLPQYGNVVLGTADLPSIKVDVRNGHTSHVDFLAELRPGQLDSIKTIANDWLHGRLRQLQVVGRADVPVKSGIFRFGTHRLSQSLIFAAKDIPALPSYNIHKMALHDAAEDRQGIVADVSLSLKNDFPIEFAVPAMGFVVSVEGCPTDSNHIRLADAATAMTQVALDQDIQISVTGLVKQLPEVLLNPCPNMPESPLDLLVTRYIKGEELTLWVHGAQSNPQGAPAWIVDSISDITLPVPFKGHALGPLIREFSLSNVNFGLPDPLSEPDSRESRPTISAIINALVNVPSQIKFDIDVGRVRALADVFYHDAKLGKLDLSHWQKANSTRVEVDQGHDRSALLIQSAIEQAPLEITDDDVFADVFQALLLGSEDVILDIKASVDVAIETALGGLVLRSIPASGSIPVQPINRDGKLGKIRLRAGDLRILDTTIDSLVFAALVNFTNPTEYSAAIPYFDVYISNNGSSLGHATTKTIWIKPGLNVNIPITVVWDPKRFGGPKGHEAGTRLLSEYISGDNTTITVSAHPGSIPSQPSLGRILAGFPVELPTPRLGVTRPSEDDGDAPFKFIGDATMHLVTSTAVFSLLSPLQSSTLYITYLNATALYRGEAVGHITEYDEPFAVAPGGVPVASPRLPVDWSLGSVGYDAVKNALGGSLKLDAEADVGVRVGSWEERVRFRGGGIGARIRL